VISDINIRKHRELPVLLGKVLFLVSITIYRVIKKKWNVYKNELLSTYHLNIKYAPNFIATPNLLQIWKFVRISATRKRQ
jgi:hypothetical protein